MTTLYGKTYSAVDLARRSGDLLQLGGILPVVLADGMERGIRALHVRSGGGLDFFVLLDRGMDIALASYRGVPLTYFSYTGIPSAMFYESRGAEWLRGFHGGLLVTCGLTHFGPPEHDAGTDYGQHGRLSYLPARDVAHRAGWQGDDYVMEVQGAVHQAAFFGENLVLERRLTVNLGEARLRIVDTVENRGFRPAPHRILYHVNPGFPLLDREATLLAASRRISSHDEVSARAVAEWATFCDPTSGFSERNYTHELAADEAGYTTVALANRQLGESGLGLYLRYSTRQLPYFHEWQMLGEGEYVLGMEPSNSPAAGRAELHAAGKMPILGPREWVEYELEIGVLPDGKDIDGVADWIRRVGRDEAARLCPSPGRRREPPIGRGRQSQTGLEPQRRRVS